MFSLSDGELTLSARRGDVEAFGELVRRHQTSVYNVCYRLSGERREAEDLTQEAFVRAFQRLDHFDVERPFGPWIRRVAANLCINRLQMSRDIGLCLDDESDEPVEAGSNNPETIQERIESAEALRAAVLSLPPAYRTVIELRHFHDLPYMEIADQLGIPLSAVKSHLFRARRLLAEKMRPDE